MSSLAQQRNILLLIADDMGIDSHSLYSSSQTADLAATPNIDALKSTGVQFTQAYAHATCSPTRASILTGRQPYRHGVTTAVTANDGQLMAGEFTLPRAFAAHSDLGYATAHFGKWHLSLGPNSENDPANIAGWPHYSGSLHGSLVGGNTGGGSYTAWTKIINGVTGPTNGTTTYATTDTADDTIAWIDAQGDEPWFAWVAFNAPHTPYHKPPNDLHGYDSRLANWDTMPVNANQRAHYNASIEAMDTEIGRIFSSIDPAVLADTWVIFIGDNGTPSPVIEEPFSRDHAKSTLYEGGVRVPLLISGPGIVNPDRESHALVQAVDLYSTILEMAGIDVAATQPAVKPIDGDSLMPLLLDQTSADRQIYSETSGSTLDDSASGTMIRDGDYKLIQFQDGTEELYLVSQDADEQTDLLQTTLSSSTQAIYDQLKLDLASQVAAVNQLNEPVETQWQTIAGAEYARIFRSQDRALAGTTDTTWTTGGPIRNGEQTTPAYAGVESIRVSPNWVYVKGSSLPHYTMGPWYFDEAKTQPFVNLPSQWDMLARIPRLPQPATSRANTNFGPIAIWVNTAIIHNQLDAFYWNGTTDVDTGATGTEYWTRNARLAEGSTFDPAGAHQPFTGESHHHISPTALRHELGDHVDYDSATHTYTEVVGAPEHSPILGWSFDGYPIYGPYGFGDAATFGSVVRRMISGFVERDGSYGTDDLRQTGRASLPQWAIRNGHGDSPVNDAAEGPAISADFPMGWYMQDYDYLGDHGYSQGTDFDLDECNGRWCVTPEFPEGTYAYFVTLDASYQPAYPYIIGRQYYGVKQGGNYAAASTVGFDAVEQPHVVTYQGGAGAQLNVSGIRPSGDDVILTWDSVEGGQYKIEKSEDLEDWTTQSPSLVTGQGATTEAAESTVGRDRNFFRVLLESIDTYDVIDTP